jgi:ubiquinone biosynthesis protein COQ9
MADWRRPEEPEHAPSDAYRERLLDAVLPLAATHGWTEATVSRAAEAAALTPGQVQLACPNGASDLLDALGRRAARAAFARLQSEEAVPLKTREKVTAGVRSYLDALEGAKPALRRASGSAHNLLSGPKAAWEAADAIWAGLGDASTDFNWYTKRLTLAAVVGSTLVAWLGTDDRAEVDAFLDNRIENVMQFERAKRQAMDALGKAPNPFDLMGRPRR